MNVERVRALEDFDAARARAFRRSLRAVLTRHSSRLRSMEPLLKAAGIEGRAAGGVQEIPVDRIAGSVAPAAKTAEFDKAFLPVDRRTRDRWTRIYREMVEGDELPPIDVYRVDGRYYVIDGHHRVSVARNLGRPTISARVIDIRTRAPVGADADAGSLLCAAEYAAFLDTTQLHRTRPDARLECGRLGRYDEILEHILGHAYFLAGEQHRAVPLPEAAASWYDHVYRPVADAIRRHDVLRRFPGSTEADVYVEITRRWLAMSQRGAEAGPDPAVEALLQDQARGWWRRRRKIRLSQ
jgi:uncharacterized ParB-like nuclease family protein